MRKDQKQQHAHWSDMYSHPCQTKTGAPVGDMFELRIENRKNNNCISMFSEYSVEFSHIYLNL